LNSVADAKSPQSISVYLHPTRVSLDWRVIRGSEYPGGPQEYYMMLVEESECWTTSLECGAPMQRRSEWLERISEFGWIRHVFKMIRRVSFWSE
jgi:hypothetical protein